MQQKRITRAQSPSQGPSWLRNTDPLGIALKQRARDTRADLNPTGLGSMGPLMDPMWDGFMQAMSEQGVDRLGDDSMWEARQRGGGKLAYAHKMGLPSVAALDKAAGTGQDHETFLKRFGR